MLFVDIFIWGSSSTDREIPNLNVDVPYNHGCHFGTTIFLVRLGAQTGMPFSSEIKNRSNSLLLSFIHIIQSLSFVAPMLCKVQTSITYFTFSYDALTYCGGVE